MATSIKPAAVTSRPLVPHVSCSPAWLSWLAAAVGIVLIANWLFGDGRRPRR